MSIYDLDWRQIIKINKSHPRSKIPKKGQILITNSNRQSRAKREANEIFVNQPIREKREAEGIFVNQPP